MQTVTNILAIAIGFSIPLSTSITEICIGLFVACWVASGDLQTKLHLIRRNQIALLSLLLLAVIAVGTTYSTATWTEAWKCLLKYRELLYVPLLVPVFQDAVLRRRGVQAFLAASLLVLALSYLEFLTGIDIGLLSNTDYVIFKDRIIHSLLMSFAAYLLAHAFVELPRWRWACGVGILLTLGNILFLIQGRTGYVVLGLLTVLFMYQHLRFRGVACACLLLAVLGGASYRFLPTVRSRVNVTIAQVWNQIGPNKKRSDDPRMEFYDNSLQLVFRHPLFGTGTGSFEPEYRKLAELKGLPVIQHLERRAPFDPHNEYLLIAVQVGLVGLAALLLLFHTEWQSSFRLAGQDRIVAQGAVVTIAAGCLFNSMLLGFTGGLFFGYFSGLACAPLSRPPADLTSGRPNAESQFDHAAQTGSDVASSKAA